MSELIRFGVSMEKEIVEALDTITLQHAHPNRSETIRTLIRQQVVEEEALLDTAEVTAVISLIFHYSTQLVRVSLQEYPSLKLTTNLQMHLEKDIVIKILVVSGQNREVNEWARKITGQKHVFGRINIAATSRMYDQLRG
jgi:CopG family nickel-responsive transcriptional regulator